MRQAGSRRTLHDIAREAQVSPATVSRVLNGRLDSRIASATRDRVLRIAERLGYEPNRIAQALVTGRTHMVGVVVPYRWYPFATDVMDCVQQRLEPLGWGMVVEGTEGDREWFLHGVRRLEGQVDGILTVDRCDLVQALVDDPPGFGKPVVSVGSDCYRGVDHVSIELGRGAADAVSHLIEQGCRRIVYVVPQISAHPHEARRLAYESTMAAAGLEPELVVFPKGTRRGAREAFLAHAAERRRLPDGLFCCNDVTALGVYRALRDLGVRIPEDVALVGCDGTDETQYVDRPISTIVMPVAQMCEQGIGFLQRRIDQPDLPLQGAELTASLCIRESSRRQVGDS